MSILLGDNFSYSGAKPLDARLTYATLASMVAAADSTLYSGIMAYCVGEDKNYQWKSTNTVDPTLGKWREFEADGGDSALWGYLYNNAFYVESTHTTVIPAQTDTIYVERESKKFYEYDGTNYVELSAGVDTVVYQPGGSVAFASLPIGSASNLGFIYNITDAFTTTSDFVEGAGIEYPANTDVAVINAGTAQSPVYKYNVFLGSLAGYQKKIQYNAMPTADAAHVGQIVQYMGVTNASYTHGYFYECVTDGTTYSWEATDVQGANGGVKSSAIAPVFDSTATYAEGDRVMYEDELYVFNTAHTGAWDAVDADKSDVDTLTEHMPATDMSEVASPMPGVMSRLPVLFDESGAEQVVGWYTLANGTKKPVYEVIVKLPNQTSVNQTVEKSLSDFNIDIAISCMGNMIYRGVTRTLPSIEIDSVYANIGIAGFRFVPSSISFSNYNFTAMASNICAILRYTKTTDTPQ